MPDIFDALDTPPATNTGGDIFDQVAPRDIFDEVDKQSAQSLSTPRQLTPQEQADLLASGNRILQEQAAARQMNEDPGAFTAALAQGIPQAIGQGLHRAGTAVRGLAEAYASEAAGDPRGQVENFDAGVAGQPSPNLDVISQMPTAQKLLAKGSIGLLESSPRLAASMVHPLAAPVAFGVTDEGKVDPKGAALAVALPFVGKYGGEIAARLAQKSGITQEAALKAVSTLGNQAAANTYLGVVQGSEIAALPEDQKKEAWIDAIANDLSMASLGLMHQELPESVREESRLAKGREDIKDSAKVVSDPKTWAQWFTEVMTGAGKQEEAKPEPQEPLKAPIEALLPSNVLSALDAIKNKSKDLSELQKSLSSEENPKLNSPESDKTSVNETIAPNSEELTDEQAGIPEPPKTTLEPSLPPEPPTDTPQEVKTPAIEPQREESPIGDTPALSDRQQYEALQDQLSKLDPSDERFQQVWKASEEIKNRNGGMPPEADTGKQYSVDEAIKEAQGATEQNASPESLPHPPGGANEPKNDLHEPPKDERFTAPDSVKSRIHQGTTVRGLLKTWSESNHPFSELAYNLLMNADPHSLNVRVGVNPELSRSKWTTEGGKERIEFSPDAPENALRVLHETLHALSATKGEKFAPLVDLMKEAQKHLGDEYAFRDKNAREFIAEAFSNPEFQKKLAGIRVGPRTLWEKFVNGVQRLLRIAPRHESLLDEVLREGARVVQAERPEANRWESLFAPVEDYGMSHRPNPNGPRAHDLAEGDMMPKDVYDHPEWYSGQTGKALRDAAQAIRKMRGNPDAEVTIYRAAPKAELNEGDWVSLSRDYAKQHGMADDPNEDVPVHSFKVKAKEIRWSMDELNEFGYFPSRANGETLHEPLKDLTDKLKATAPKTAPLGRKLDLIAQAKLDASTAGERIKNAAAKGLAITEALWDKYSKPEAFTDEKAAAGRWTYALQKADHEARQFALRIQKEIPDPLRREAITNWIQADGDLTLLKDRAAASKDKYRPGYEAAQNLNPRELEIAKMLKEYFDAQLKIGLKEGILKSGIEDYVTQAWKRENPVTRTLVNELSTGKLQPNFQYARKRVFDSYFEGEQAGYEPRSKDIGALVAHYDQSFYKALAARAFIKELKEGKASDGRPLVALSGGGDIVDTNTGSFEPGKMVLVKPEVAAKETRDYKPIDHPAMRGWKFVTEINGTPILVDGELKAHPEIASDLKDRLGSSWFRKYEVMGVKPFDSLLKLQSGFKQTMLSLSGFHQMQETFHALGHRVDPTALANIDFNDPTTKALVSHGLQLAGDFRAMESFAEGLSSGGLANKMADTTTQALFGKKFLGPYTEWLFQDYIPRLKLSMAQHALERNRERYGGKYTEDQILEITASQANAAFGELNLKYMARNPTMQDFWRMFLLAPDFLEARARFTGQALTPKGKEQLQALMLLGGGMYLTARIANQLLNDDPHWEKENAFSIIWRGHRITMRSVPADIMHLATDWRSFSYHRLAPIVGRGAVELLSGRNERGVKESPAALLKDLAKNLIPISMRNSKEQALWESMLNALGISNYRYDAVQQIGDKVKKFKEAEGKKSAYEFIYDPDSDAYKPLRDALSNGDETKARAAYQSLLKTIPATKIAESQRNYYTKPLTGSAASEQKFLATLDEGGKKEYAAAQKLRRERFEMFNRVAR